MARDLGLTARQIPGFRFTHPQTDKDFLATIAFGHEVDVEGMLKYHARYDLLLFTRDTAKHPSGSKP